MDVYIHCLDHSFYTLLAAGYFGFGTVSCFLDPGFAIPITGYSSGWAFWFTKRYHYAAGEIVPTLVVLGIYSKGTPAIL